MNTVLKKKIEALQLALNQISFDRNLSIAFSGGLDSRFLAFACHYLGFTVELFHVTGPHVPSNETLFARSWATQQHLLYREIYLNPLALPLVREGSRLRCYECKKTIFSKLKELTQRPLCDGTNASDKGLYRPGSKAIIELGIHSPLSMAMLTKDDIHQLAAFLNMDWPEQQPRPCLLTRYPYGVTPIKSELEDIDKAEQAISQALKNNAVDFRLRLVGQEKAELHLLKKDEQILSLATRQRIQENVKTLAPSLPKLRIVGVEKLSGFYDRTSTQTEDGGS